MTADYHAGTTQLFGDLGYRIDLARLELEPFANLAYIGLHTGGFTERGGAAALTSRSMENSVTSTTLGLRASTTLALGGINATARGALGWRHAFGDTTPFSTFASPAALPSPSPGRRSRATPLSKANLGVRF